MNSKTDNEIDSAADILPAYFRGRQEQATYTDTGIWRYKGNPLIEALGSVLTEKEAGKLMASYPPYGESERNLPAEVRVHLTHTLLDVFVSLPAHIDLEQRLSCLIRSGYVPRHPLAQDHWKKVRTATSGWDLETGRTSPMRSTATGFNVIGISGGGKSSGIQKVLSLYSQLVFHYSFKKLPFTFCQIVWLMMSCPFDASTRGLCLDFFRIIDDLAGTNHYRRYAKGRRTTDEMLPDMARVAAVHGLGVLVIDEIQFLSESSSGGRVRMLNFFCDLTNRIGLPVVFVGTYKALAMLKTEFRQIRRGFGEGEKRWERLLDARTWRFFLKAIWRYQYVKQPTPLTDECYDLFFDLTQGIPDLCMKLYMLSQIRAIRTGIEAITPAVVRSVAKDCFISAEPVLDALRRNDIAALELISDVHPVDIDECIRALDKVADSSSLIPSPEARKLMKRTTTLIGSKQNSPAATASDGKCLVDSGPAGPSLTAGDKDQPGYGRLRSKGFIRSGEEFLNNTEAA
ncbi:MAG TPA: ATP-binding protein [Verrucomicrobiae bacterium]|jgi:hypothetical protein|nr:ATP-binding protein [Verrucomicrobiae bacterium]